MGNQSSTTCQDSQQSVQQTSQQGEHLQTTTGQQQVPQAERLQTTVQQRQGGQVPQMQGAAAGGVLPAQLAPPAAQARRSPPPAALGFIDGAPMAFNDDDEVQSAMPPDATNQPEPDPATASEAVLSVGTRIEYSSLPRGQMKDVFGLVTVAATEAPTPEPGHESTSRERQPMDLACVLDVSYSMSGEKINQVKSAVRFIMDQATSKDRVSIVKFNSSAERVLRMRKMDSEGKDEANVQALRLEAGGGTRIANGLDLGLQVMEQRRSKNAISSILLLTDGQDGSTRGRLPELLARARDANCSVYAFGFGKDHDAGLLSELAEIAQTPFTFVEDAENIREAFAGAVGGLSSIVAQGVSLNINSHVPLKNVHSAFTTVRSTDRCVTVKIPDMFAGEKRDILVELSVPADDGSSGETTLLDSFAEYTDVRSGGLARTGVSTMVISVADEPQPEGEPDAEVAAQRERVEVTQALQAASVQSDLGQFEEAQQLLQAADEHLRSKKTVSRFRDALTRELDDAKGRMRSRSQWEGGGKAELADAVQMHSKQRCTNMMHSKSGMAKMSKQMYCTSAQASWINRSKAG